MRDLLRAAPIALALLTALSLPARAQGIKVAYVQTSVLLEQAGIDLPFRDPEDLPDLSPNRP